MLAGEDRLSPSAPGAFVSPTATGKVLCGLNGYRLMGGQFSINCAYTSFAREGPLVLPMPGFSNAAGEASLASVRHPIPHIRILFVQQLQGFA